MSVESNGSRKTEIVINHLSDKQEEELRSIGGKVLRVTNVLETIQSMKRAISKEKGEISAYERSPIKAELGKYFAITINDPDAIRLYGSQMIDNGRRSGVVVDKFEGTVRENSGEHELPLMFFAISYVPYSKESWELINGYQFNGLGGYDLDVDIDRQNDGKPLGVELGTVTFLKAYDLISEGKVALPFSDQEQVDAYLRSIQNAIERDTSPTGKLEAVAIVSEN